MNELQKQFLKDIGIILWILTGCFLLLGATCNSSMGYKTTSHDMWCGIAGLVWIFLSLLSIYIDLGRKE